MSEANLDTQPCDCLVVHTSDVHVDDDFVASQFNGDGCWHLRRVVAAATRLNAHALLLVGDTFDHNRLPARVVDRAAEILSEFPGVVTIMPGNHDPAMDDSVYWRGCFAGLDRVHILGVTCEESVILEDCSLEIWGRPHLHFGDMSPLEAPPPRKMSRRIALAHGHYEPEPDRTAWPRPFWLIGDADLVAADADYIALGHWNRAIAVGGGKPPAWYSGSPDYAGTVNVVRFSAGDLSIAREAIDSSSYSASG